MITKRKTSKDEFVHTSDGDHQASHSFRRATETTYVRVVSLGIEYSTCLCLTWSGGAGPRAGGGVSASAARGGTAKNRLSTLVYRYSTVSSRDVPAPPGVFLPAVTRLPHAPSFRLPPLSRRGEALWERAEAGSGLLGAASSESAAGSGRLRACGC